MTRRQLASGFGAAAWLSVIAAILLSIFGIQAIFHYRAATFPFSGTGFIVSDPHIGYAGMPNAEMHYLGSPVYHVFTNERGGRDSYRGKKAPEKVDFLFVGDSYIWGAGVSDEDTFAKALARQLGVSVFNAAEPNYSMVAALLSIDKFADMKPRYVVFGFMAEVLPGIFSPCAHTTALLCRAMAYLDRGPAGLEIRPPADDAHIYSAYIREIVFQHSFGLRDIYWAAYRDISLTLSNAKRVRALARQGGGGKASDWTNDPRWSALGLRFLIDEMAKKASSLGARLMFLNLPNHENYSPPQEVLQAIEDGRSGGKFLYTDSSPLLREAAASHGIHHVRIPGDGHFTAAGHGIIADAIAAALDSRSLPLHQE
jgi:hypothetical protein